MENLTLIKSKFLKNLFDQNTYVISNETQAVIIDAGAELEDVKNVVGNKKVLAILMTHLHFDHFWNLNKYLEYFDCFVYVCENAEYKFSDFKSNGATVIRQNITQEIGKTRIKYYAKKLQLGDFEFEIINTPGHAEDCVCILHNDIIFTGDIVFEDGVGRTDLVDSDNQKLENSLKNILQLNYKVAYPGHYGSATKQQVDNIIKNYL